MSHWFTSCPEPFRYKRHSGECKYSGKGPSRRLGREGGLQAILRVLGSLQKFDYMVLEQMNGIVLVITFYKSTVSLLIPCKMTMLSQQTVYFLRSSAAHQGFDFE